jgi:hypothetical protein
MKKQVVFLTHSPPLQNKGSGLSVLLYSILSALPDFERTIITFCGEAKVDPAEIRKDNADAKVIICDSLFNKLYRYKVARLYRSFLIGISFIFSLGKIGRRINKPDTLVITAIGASAIPLWKFLLLKALFKKAKHGLYIVDDLHLINQKLNNRSELLLIKLFLERSIRRCDRLLVISNGLQENYKKLFNVDSLLLLPHFAKRDALPANLPGEKFTFLFSGGLSFLYNAPLYKFAEVLDSINKEGACKYKLELKIQTYTPKPEFDRLGFNNLPASYSTVNNRSELINIYTNSNCFIVPYTFEAGDRAIVETSFPQKVAELIQYNRPILLFSPAYSSVAIFFKNNQLSYLCSNENTTELKQAILSVVDEYYSFNSKNYIKAYDEYLSAESVNSTFNNLLDL